MCLAVPGRIESIERGTDPLMGSVNFGGVRKRVCLEWVPDAREGDYAIVHVGFAINTIDEEEARRTLDLFEQIGSAENEVNVQGIRLDDTP